MKIKSFKPKLNNPLAQYPSGSAQTPAPPPSINFQGLKVIPLGGVGDVTKNMYVYEYGNDIITIDCGIGFPDEGMLGIDLVIPDVSYLNDKKERIRGMVISHGHEDHIGGLPYIWPSLQAPIYAHRLAAGFIKTRFTEHNLPKNKINTVSLDTKLKLGVFELSFYRVSHSVPDATGIIIDTPVGRIIHQADFKLDWTPINGEVTDVGKVAMAGERGVLLMLIDALGSEKPGYTLSERTIQPTFVNIERDSPGKMLITTTSSNISRIQQAVNVAEAVGRKIALVGRSVESNFQVSRDLGYLKVAPGTVIASDEIKRFPDRKLMIIIAGSQGQAGSALSRVANNDHKQVSLKRGDSVVFSADPIPGSEAAQSALIDKLTQQGMDVYYSAITDALHVSGHARAEEIKLMVKLANPKYLLPIGAGYKQMKVFSKLMQQMGYSADKILLLEDGDVAEIRPGQARLNGRVEAKNVYVDGLGVGDIGTVVLRDRKVMAEEGIVLVIVPVDTHTSKLTGEPDIVSRGFVFEKESEELLREAREVVKSALADHADSILDWRFIRRHIEENLEKFFYEETKRRPLVLPVVVEV